ncbi:MAG: hypothetical protein ACPG21_14415 [Crocinitomicaceae bacterium]
MRYGHVWKLVVLSVLFASCDNGEPQEEVISMEDLMGEFGDEIETNDDVALEEDTVQLAGPLGSFLSKELGKFDTTISDKFHLLDRFSFNTREKINFKSKEEVPYGESTMVTPRANLFYYAFEDTTKTKNAFYNWLDCFGSDCAMVKLEEEVDAIKMPPAYALVYDTMIVAVNYRCEDAEYSWNEFEKSLKQSFEQDPLYEIKVGCGGPLKWK